MDAILQTEFQNVFYAIGKVEFRWCLFLRVGVGPCNNLGRIGDKPLSEPMLTKIYDAIWRQ